MLKALRDNLGLLGLVVTLVGVSSTEAYYASFGLKYQLLALPASHILYRGLSAVFETPIIAFIYLIAAVAIIFQGRLGLAFGGLDRLRWINYVLVLMLGLAAWFAGRHQGLRAAMEDAMVDKSTLPMVQTLSMKAGSTVNGVDGVLEGYRLLLQTSAGTYIVRPVSDPTTKTALIKFFSGGSIDQVTICARC